MLYLIDNKAIIWPVLIANAIKAECKI